jgi:hypothetical protein
MIYLFLDNPYPRNAENIIPRNKRESSVVKVLGVVIIKLQFGNKSFRQYS